MTSNIIYQGSSGTVIMAPQRSLGSSNYIQSIGRSRRTSQFLLPAELVQRLRWFRRYKGEDTLTLMSRSLFVASHDAPLGSVCYALHPECATGWGPPETMRVIPLRELHLLDRKGYPPTCCVKCNKPMGV